MGWGAGWGGGWGHFSSAGFSLDSARAVFSNAVRVTFGAQPYLGNGVLVQDALHVGGWVLTRDDDGLVIPLLASRRVVGDPFSVELIIAGSFDYTGYTLTASGFLSVGGASLVLPATARFTGMPAVATATAAQRPLIDILNPQTANRINGALVVGSNGDYRQEAGVQLLKKLIFRRLTTAQGEFYHLSGIEYGLGLRAKEFYTRSGLIILKTKIENQVRQEPEVGDVAATVTLGAKGSLLVALRVKLRLTDQKISFSFPIQQEPIV